MTKPQRRILIYLSFVAALALGSACSPGDKQSEDTIAPAVMASADTIYHGGPIVTVDDTNPTAEAVAVKDGRIVAVGSEAEVMSRRGDTTEVIDLAGKTLLPGFIDAHGHVFNTGLQAQSANLLSQPDGQVNDIAALQQTLGDWLAENRNGFASTGWIIGFGYDDSQLSEQRHPTRDDLDRVSLTMPVIVIHQSGHLASVNSKGLELAGVTAESVDPAGGVYRRYESSSEPNGVLEEMAFFQIVFSIMATLSEEENRALLLAGIDLYASFGFTTAQEGRATKEAVATIAAAAADNRLIMDVVAYPDIQSAVDTIKPPSLAQDYDHRFRIGGAKLSLDGSPQGKTAWLTRPYLVPPAGQAADYVGYPAITDEEAIAYVDQAFGNGWQLLVHTNGDAAADQLIMAVRAATEKHGKGDRRTVMIHAQTVREDQLDAMKELGIIPSFFGMHTFYWGDWHRESVLGPERAARISPAASALKRDMIYTQHHDAPVALPNSIMVIASQVNRTTRSGQVLGPEQRVTVMDAIRSITINAAYQHFEEKTKGSIEPGKIADFVILDRNPLEIEPRKISSIRILKTIKEGRPIYSAAPDATVDDQR